MGASLSWFAFRGKTPEDVATFQERRTQCDHFRGEEPYDETRARFLTEQLGKYCAGSDAELAKLLDGVSAEIRPDLGTQPGKGEERRLVELSRVGMPFTCGRPAGRTTSGFLGAKGLVEKVAASALKSGYHVRKR